VDLFGFEEGGHGVAAEERQVAPEDQAVKAGQGPLDGVRVLADELVHPRIAPELGRERNPRGTTPLVRILDPERHQTLPAEDVDDTLGPIGPLIAPPQGQPSRSHAPHPIFDRGPGRQLPEMSPAFRGERAQPSRLGLVAAARPRCAR